RLEHASRPGDTGRRARIEYGDGRAHVVLLLRAIISPPLCNSATMGRHFSVSPKMSDANSCAVPPHGIMPCARSSALTRSERTAAVTAAFRRLVVASGSPQGPAMPTQFDIS